MLQLEKIIRGEQLKNNKLLSNLLITWGGIIILYAIPIIITFINNRGDLIIFQQGSFETYLNSRAYFIWSIMILLPIAFALFNILQGLVLKKIGKTKELIFPFYLQIATLVYIIGLVLILQNNFSNYYHLFVLVFPLAIIFLTYNKSVKKK